LASVCIFCGEAPESKTKEHIFPQWLLKMTGFHSKNTSVGTNWATGKEIVFPAKNYTFPACDACNNNFASLEGTVKGIIERLSEDADISGGDLEILLDWFDKIRIGAWLGIFYINKSFSNQPPNHYINDRVGIKDRYLSITNTYLPEKTLNWSGANTMTFMTSPTALALRVNNLVFVSASTDFLVSKSVGFPFASWEMCIPESKIGHFMLSPGTGKIKPDCFKCKPYVPSHIVRQPMFKAAREASPDLYTNQHVQSHSYDSNTGIGKLFIQKSQRTYVLERNDRVDFQMEAAKSVYGRVPVVRPILELQIEMLKSRLNRLKYVSEVEKHKQLLAAKEIISYTNEQIRLYNY
jgi:hypothetical protein